MKKLLIASLFTAAALCAHGDLIGYWSFDNDNLIESSGFTPAGTHDGVAVGAIAYSTGPTGFGQALDLTAANTAVTVLNSSVNINGSAGGGANPNYQGTFDSPVFTSGPHSIAMWVQGEPGRWNPFLSKQGESVGYQLRKRNRGPELCYTLRGTAGGPDPTGGSNTWNDPAGEWHHLVAVWDSENGNRLLYIDGVLDGSSITNGSDTGTIGDASTYWMVFGARDNGSLGNFSALQLDEIRIYNEALSEAEVLDVIAGNYDDGDQLTWVGDGSANWNTNIANTVWTNVPAGGGLTNWTTGNNAIFDDSSAFKTVNLAVNLGPSSATVSNSVAYTFVGGSITNGSLTKRGVGSLTLNGVTTTYGGGTTIEEGTLIVANASAQTLIGLSGSGSLTKSGSSKLTVSGANNFSGSATVESGNTLEILNSASGNASYNVNASGTLAVTKDSGDATLSVSDLTLGATTTLTLDDGAVSSLVPILSTANLTNNGTVTVDYSATSIAPGTIVLIDYEAATSVVGAFAGPSLPPGYSGSLVTNVANSSIDLVITTVPAKIWSGTASSSWDDFSLNWNSGVAAYVSGDYVQFDDSGANTTPINVFVSPADPSLMYVSNSTTAYWFASGSITTALLVKEGSGTVSLQSGLDSFTTVDLRAGTLSYEATTTETATIEGDGTLNVDNGQTLTLSGDMSGFDGPITVSSGTLILGGSGVLGTTNGTTTVASGATLDVNGTVNQGEQVIASGDGIFFSGAINNSGGQQYNALEHVSLAGDTTLSADGSRWDIRAQVSTNLGTLNTTGGNAILTKRGLGDIGFVNVDIANTIKDITIEAGALQLEGYTSDNVGDSSSTLTVWASAGLKFYQNDSSHVPQWNKILSMQAGTFLEKLGGTKVIWAGPITIQGGVELRGNGGELEISGAVGDGGFFAGITKIGNGDVTLSGANSYLGETVVSSGSGTLKLSTASTLASLVQVSSGNFGAVRTLSGATLTVPNLIMTNAVGLVFDLGAFGTPGAASLINATLLTNGGSAYNVTVEAELDGLGVGTIDLLTYPFGALTNQPVDPPTLPEGVVGVVTNNTAQSKLQLVVSSVSRNLNWVGNESSVWNIDTIANWVVDGLTNPTVYKEVGLLGDDVTFGNGASNYTVNLQATVSPATMLVNGTNDYTINSGSFSIAGPVQLDLNIGAANTATLTGVNAHTGGTYFNNGTTVVSSDAALGSLTNLMRFNGGAVRYTGSATNTRVVSVEGNSTTSRIMVDTNQTVELGGTYATTGTTIFRKSGPGALSLTGTGTQRLYLEEGSAILSGNAAVTNTGTQYWNIGATNGTIATLVFKDNALFENGGNLNIADGAGRSNDVANVYVQDNALLALGGLQVGKFINATGRVYQTGGTVTTNAGTSTVYLGGNSANETNTFGGYYLSGGTLNIPNKDMEVGRHGRGELVVSGTGTMTAQNLNVAGQNNVSSLGAVTVNGTTVTLNGELRVPQAGTAATAVITNNGTVTATALVLGTANNNANSGSVTVGSGGTLTVGQVSGSANTRNIAFDDATLAANASSATFMEGLTSATIGSGGLTVDTGTNAIRINQDMTGGGGLTKEGAGELTLESQSYTGDTVVNAGTLKGDELSPGTILTGDLVVNGGGTVSPGQSIQNILANAVTLSGTAEMEIAKVGTFNFNSDKVQANTLLTRGGTVNVTFDSTHTTALSAGNTFTLFQAGATAGAFTTANLPTTDPVNENTIAWTDNLNSAGSITVLSSTPPVTPGNPQNVQLDGSGNLVFSITNASGTYRVQGATNLASPVWVDVATNTAPFNFTNNATLPEEYFRTVTP